MSLKPRRRRKPRAASRAPTRAHRRTIVPSSQRFTRRVVVRSKPLRFSMGLVVESVRVRFAPRPSPMTVSVLVEALPQRRCRTRMLSLQRASEIVQEALGGVDLSALVCFTYRRAHLVVSLVRKMADDVADLVHLAALHEGSSTEQVSDGGAKALAPVDDEEPCSVRFEPTLNEVLEHCLARDLVLRGSFPETKHVLGAARIDPQSAEHDVVAKVQAVDEDRPDVELTERTRHPLRELLRRDGNEATTDRALAHATRLDVFWHRVERASVLAGCDADGHLLESAHVERVAARKLRPGLERHFLAVAIGDAGPTHTDATTPQRKLPSSRTRARRRTRPVMPVSRSAQLRALGFEHRGERLQAELVDKRKKVRRAPVRRAATSAGSRLRLGLGTVPWHSCSWRFLSGYAPRDSLGAGWNRHPQLSAVSGTKPIPMPPSASPVSVGANPVQLFLYLSRWPLQPDVPAMRGLSD